MKHFKKMLASSTELVQAPVPASPEIGQSFRDLRGFLKCLSGGHRERSLGVHQIHERSAAFVGIRRDMEIPDEIEELRRCNSDLARTLELTATWMGRDSTLVAESLLDLLSDMLELDMVYLRLDEAAHSFVRIDGALGPELSSERLSAVLAPWTETDPQQWPTHISIGDVRLSITALRVGIAAGIGFLVAGSRRETFPSNSERLRLSVATRQAALAFREMRQLSDRRIPLAGNNGNLTVDALTESEGKLRLLIDTIPAMAWSTNADGMAEFFNRHQMNYVGRDFDELRGLGYLTQFHPDDLPRMLGEWQTMMASKLGGELEGRVRRADGEYRWTLIRTNPLLDEQGNVIRWYGVNTDIEDRKRAEDALKAAQSALSVSERNLNLIMDSLPVLIWASRPDGSADFVNDQFLDYVGLPVAEVLDWGYLNVWHPEDREQVLIRWQAQLDADTATNLVRIRRFDQVYRWFYLSGQKFKDATGNVRWFGVALDIEDLKRAEDELRESQAELAHVTRMITMGELAVSIAHEVNQPLMAIVTNAGTCLRWLDEEQLDIMQARQAAERIGRDGQRAGEIIASIRALARKSPLKFDRMILEHAIEAVLDLMQGELRREGIKPTLEFPKSRAEVFGDRTQLQQVILNLIMNSAEAMAGSSHRNRELVIRTSAGSDGFAHVSIEDTGPGLDPDTFDHLFDAFFTTKPGGIGMGLSICRSIIEAHGGHISASQNSPEGSVFSFTVPLAGEAASDQQRVPS